MNGLICHILLVFLSAFQGEYECEVHISGIRNTSGNIIVSVFIDEASFKKEEPMYSKVIPKTSVVNGEVRTRLTLPGGRYGIALLDDENDDGEMKYNLIGIPQEGFGFSNFEHQGLKKPRLEDFIFTLDSSGQTIQVKVKYM